MEARWSHEFRFERAINCRIKPRNHHCERYGLSRRRRLGGAWWRSTLLHRSHRVNCRNHSGINEQRRECNRHPTAHATHVSTTYATNAPTTRAAHLPATYATNTPATGAAHVSTTYTTDASTTRAAYSPTTTAANAATTNAISGKKLHRQRFLGFSK